MDPTVFAQLASQVENGNNLDLRNQLKAAVDGLRPELRDLVNAVIWERVPKREMVRRLGVRRCDVEKMLHEAFDLVREAMEWSRDAYYESKRLRGLLASPLDYLTDEEMNATMQGRSRGDGRRIDAYTSDDPVEEW